ncbi:hypothetical protein [Candidatus Nitrosotenuis sp. DW1]|uniref:hypothetical protein n=1 Tax=Candidatus Nitrosotenuis sp. DW1 TaxID=2259672 RepID=UPI0015CA25EE|nr:hypothetical protein [Candidatus Nitrosotenuis sp. DW1]QLH09588.1 hypothetical protein DSQ19_09055 [Candidatus Nitrosotenuis sp. DW1]
MQEIALVISSIAGACTAATVSKFPRSKISLLGANAHIKSQIETLRIEKDILTKTISRLYQDSSDLTKIQRDKLLSRYQHQLGIILAKIEKLEAASKYPDLGPIGDGLITLMDQKLSALDRRLTEISSKISVASVQIEKPEPKKEEIKVETKQVEIKPAEKPVIQKQEIVTSPTIEELIQSFAKPTKRLEITTLTEIPRNFTASPQITPIEIPAQVVTPQIQPEIVQPQMIQPEPKQEIIAESIPQKLEVQSPVLEPIDIEKKIREEPPKLEFKEERKKKPTVNIPEPEEVEDDEDDLDSIKREIMKTLSKLEQAEVE